MKISSDYKCGGYADVFNGCAEYLVRSWISSPASVGRGGIMHIGSLVV